MDFQIFHRVFAQTATANTDIGPVNNVADYINRMLPTVYGVLGSLSLLMLIYAGYVYMTSQGSPERITLAKDLIIGVITGIALIFLMGLLLRTIGTVR